MLIRFFTKGDRQVASSRYRAYFIAEELKRRGYEVDVVPLTEYKIEMFFVYLRLIRKADRIYLQRTIYNKYFFMAIIVARLIFGKHFIFDIDDAVYHHSYLKTAIMVFLADTVTCGGHKVMDWVKKYNKHCVLILNGMVLPSVNVFKKITPPDDGVLPVIGWIGDGPAHYENLKMLPEVFALLISEGVFFSVKIVGTLGDERIPELFKNISGLKIEYINRLNWSDQEEVQKEIKKFRIGIMPLGDSPWNKAKYLKVLEYMGCSVPVVGSNRGELKHLIIPGFNGELVDTPNDWGEKLAQLISDPALCLKMGINGRKIVEDNFTLAKMADKIEKLFKKNE